MKVAKQSREASRARSGGTRLAGKAEPSKLNWRTRCGRRYYRGGFTDLSSALFLPRRWRTVVSLEARHVGFGASGQWRTGDPRRSTIRKIFIATYRLEHGKRMIDDLSRGAADHIFSLVREHAILCSRPFAPDGFRPPILSLQPLPFTSVPDSSGRKASKSGYWTANRLPDFPARSANISVDMA